MTAPCSRARRAENPEVFAAARVGLGALGVVSTITLRCVPAFTFAAVNEPMRLDDVLEVLDEHVEGNDHFEFNWFPHTEWVQAKQNNRVDEPSGAARPGEGVVRRGVPRERRAQGRLARRTARPVDDPRPSRVSSRRRSRTSSRPRSRTGCSPRRGSCASTRWSTACPAPRRRRLRCASCARSSIRVAC